MRRRDGISSRINNIIPPPFEQRSKRNGLAKPFSENWAVGKESSNFVSDKSSISKYSLIWELRKPNLFRNELIFSCPIIGRFKLFLLNFSRFDSDVPLRLLSILFKGSQVFSLGTMESGFNDFEGCSGSHSLLPEHPLTYHNDFIFSTKLFARQFEPF